MLALCGGLVGLVLAGWANQLLIRSFATVMPFTLTLDLRPDLPVFLATFFFCLLATLLAGMPTLNGAPNMPAARLAMA